MKHPLGRRLALPRFLWQRSATAVGGCGFQPVYMPTASGKPGVAQRELSTVFVEIIPGTAGPAAASGLAGAVGRRFRHAGQL